jgi:hypothetical protein
MQPAQHPSARLRLVVLNEVDGADVRFKIGLLECFHEIASAVAKHTGLEDEDALDGCFLVFHTMLCHYYSVQMYAKMVRKTNIRKSFPHFAEKKQRKMFMLRKKRVSLQQWKH